MTLAELLTAIAGGAILVPFIQGGVATLKTALPTFPNKYWPAVSILVGIGFNLLFCYITNGWWVVAALVGAIAGMAAAKVYEYGQTVDAAKDNAPRWGS